MGEKSESSGDVSKSIIISLNLFVSSCFGLCKGESCLSVNLFRIIHVKSANCVEILDFSVNERFGSSWEYVWFFD